MKESRFVGGLGGLIGTMIVAGLLISFTLGIATPWALCRLQRYITNNTIVEGKRLQFVGKGGALIGQWIKWMLLTLVTLGIYGFWVPIKVQSWVVENTRFANAEEVASAEAE